MHADFINAWDPVELARRVTGCINAGYNCGKDGYPIVHGGGPGPTDAYATVQAESYADGQGVSTEPTSDANGGLDVTSIADGSVLHYRNLDFGTAAPFRFDARVASGTGNSASGIVQIRLDSPDSTPVGTFAVGDTGGWQDFQTVLGDITTPITGMHDAYLTFHSGQPAPFTNINWFTFEHH